MKRWMVMAAAVAVLAGCGGDSEPAASEATDKGSPSSSPSQSIKTATTAQYASLIAEQRADIDSLAADLDGCLAADDGAACITGPLMASMQADIVLLAFSGAAKKTAPAYIGDPPAELEKLVDDTKAAAAELKAVADAYLALPDCPNGPQCDGAHFQVRVEAGQLKSQVDAWEPYL